MLSFEDERVPAIQINPADGIPIIAMAGHDPLEYVIVAFTGGAGRIGMRQIEHVAKLGEK